MLGPADAAGDGQWPILGENAGARIAFFLRAIPVSRVRKRPKLLHFIRIGSGFLKTKNVRLFFRQIIEEILAQHGAQAVHVPGDQFHGRSETRYLVSYDLLIFSDN